MTRVRHLLAVFLAAAVTLLGTAPPLWAIPFSKTKIIIEVNATAGDAGIQISVDATGWTRLEVFDPNGLKIFEGSGDGSVALQGVTELFFESAEPSFDDLSLQELFDRFPKGMYSFVGVTTDGQTLTGKAPFNHFIPDEPTIVSPTEGAAVNPNLPVVIDWEPVTAPFPGTDSGLKIVRYQVIVERLKPQPLLVFSVDLPASVTQVTVSPEFLQAKADYNIEVLAIEAGGNQTIAERKFKTQ
ncbi:MAG: hypothetical protein ACRD35_07775 [Candidatus Acidiferrales bacterium]